MVNLVIDKNRSVREPILCANFEGAILMGIPIPYALESRFDPILVKLHFVCVT